MAFQEADNMNRKQKNIILAMLKNKEISKNYTTNYWFSHKDFLDPTDNFTDFACERLDGKQGYASLIEHLLGLDETAKIFVQVYGLEDHNNEQFIYADTLIIFSKLSLTEIKQFFYQSEDLFPSDVGEETDFPQSTFFISDNGKRIPCAELYDNDHSVYYCWWD